MCRLDVDGPDLAAVLAGPQVGPGDEVRVVEAEARWTRGERDAPMAVCRYERRALFGGAVDVDRHGLAVPVQLLGRVGVVVDIERDRPAFAQSNHGTGELAVVQRGRDDAVRRELDEARADVNRVSAGASTVRADDGESLPCREQPGRRPANAVRPPALIRVRRSMGKVPLLGPGVAHWLQHGSRKLTRHPRTRRAMMCGHEPHDHHRPAGADWRDRRAAGHDGASGDQPGRACRLAALATTRLAFLGYPVTPWILTALALGELVTDQLPGTPSRTVPIQFGTRILMGGLTGGAIGATGGALAIGVVAGVVGAVIGTLGGRACRARLAEAFGSDRPAALIEDLVAIGGALLDRGGALR